MTAENQGDTFDEAKRATSEESEGSALPERFQYLDEWVGRDWDLTPGMTEVWLLAAVVQVVGVVAIVTRHLFPDRGGGEVSA